MADDGPKLTILGRIFILIFIAGCGYGAYLLFNANRPAPSSGTNPSNSPKAVTITADVEIGIAYGTEKQRWLEWALSEFQKTEQGKKIQVDLIPMGSLEGARAILRGDRRINVWSPASSLYADVFNQEWQLKSSKAPILRQEQLALTPMVFVFWQERYQPFVAKYNEVSFKTIERALHESGGWQAIAQQPEWGIFKFGHTHPNESNSGLATLYLMLCEFSEKSRSITLSDVVNDKFSTWMASLESGVSGLSNSTGNMMRDMVLRGPSSYDALFVYESVAIDYLKSAQGRWGDLRIVYPKLNLWNDNPYCILDAPWSSEEQKKAAGVFLDFLMSDPIQRASLDHGFRPGNLNIAIRFPESPFVRYESAGLKVEIGSVVDSPKAEVINNLLGMWQRTRGSK
jgi:Ca-activated chloride channel family protein